MILDNNGNRLFYLDFGEGSWGSKVKDVIIKDDHSFDVGFTNRNNMNLNLHPAGGVACYYTENRFLDNQVTFPANPMWTDFSIPTSVGCWCFGEPHMTVYPSTEHPDSINVTPDCYSLYLWGEQGLHSNVEYEYVRDNTLVSLRNNMFSKPNSFCFALSDNYKTKERGSRYSVLDKYIKKVDLSEYNRVYSGESYVDGFKHFRITGNDNPLTGYIFSNTGVRYGISQWAIIACDNCTPYDITNITLYEANRATKTYTNAFADTAGLRLKKEKMDNGSWLSKGRTNCLEGYLYESYTTGDYQDYTTTTVRELNRPWTDGERTYKLYLIETRCNHFVVGSYITTPKYLSRLYANGISSPIYMAYINNPSKSSACRIVSEYFELNDLTYLAAEDYKTSQLFFLSNPKTLPDSWNFYDWNKLENGV